MGFLGALWRNQRGEDDGRGNFVHTLVFGLNGVPGHLVLDDVRVLMVPDSIGGFFRAGGGGLT